MLPTSLPSLVPTPEKAIMQVPVGPQPLEALRQEQAHTLYALGMPRGKRLTGRNLSSPSWQAPRGNPIAARDPSEVPPRCSPLGTQIGFNSLGQPPGTPQKPPSPAALPVPSSSQILRGERLGGSSFSRTGRRVGWLWNFRPERTTRRPNHPATNSQTCAQRDRLGGPTTLLPTRISRPAK